MFHLVLYITAHESSHHGHLTQWNGATGVGVGGAGGGAGEGNPVQAFHLQNCELNRTLFFIGVELPTFR